MSPPQILQASLSNLPHSGHHLSTATLLRSRHVLGRLPLHSPQVRAFRIGLWSSYLNPEYQKEFRQRRRAMKNKYLETLNRSVWWNRPLVEHATRPGFKNFMCSSRAGDRSYPNGKWHSMESELRQFKQKYEETRKFQANDLVNLLRRERERILGLQREEDIQSRPSDSLKKSAEAKTPNTDREYDIDPITNRKVFRNESPPSLIQQAEELYYAFNTPGRERELSQTAKLAQETARKSQEESGQNPGQTVPPIEGLLWASWTNGVRSGTEIHSEKHNKSNEPLSGEEANENDTSIPQFDGQMYCAFHAPGHEKKTSQVPIIESEKDSSHLENLEMTQSQNESSPAEHKTFDGKSKYSPVPTPPRDKLRRPSAQDRIEDLDLLRTSDVKAASGISKGPRKETEAEKAAKRKELEEDFKNSRNKFIEDLKIEHSEILNHVAHARGKVDAKIAEVDAGWTISPQDRQMTGNYVRDFPEEFTTTWSNNLSEHGTLSPDKVSGKCQAVPAIENEVQKAEKEHLDSLGNGTVSTSSTSEINKIQTSLDRSLNGEPTRETSSSSIQTSTGVAEHKKDQKTAPKATDSARPLPHAPTVYKILAYDPIMQSINEAETTSIVPDSDPPLSPAEVLLRLSNPAKFFPHFAPLQSQGYEIISGSGDVLVFRKVREGAPILPKGPTLVRPDYKPRRNPIDGMVATGNFASPTGFVNHDLPETTESENANPPFKSNIDVRREEAVFSGKSNWSDIADGEKKKSGRGKRFLVGAFWVGACSYAVGVVAEFFKTGGVDGLGPKGF